MNLEQQYTHLFRQIPSVVRVVLLIALIGLSALSLILAYRYFNRQKYVADLRNPWLGSAMEKGLSVQGSHPASACDILKPLSQTNSCPTSGALAAMALGTSNEISNTSDGVGASTITLGNGESIQRYDGVQRMSDEDSEGVRTWKRLVVEYR